MRPITQTCTQFFLFALQIIILFLAGAHCFIWWNICYLRSSWRGRIFFLDIFHVQDVCVFLSIFWCIDFIAIWYRTACFYVVKNQIMWMSWMRLSFPWVWVIWILGRPSYPSSLLIFLLRIEGFLRIDYTRFCSDVFKSLHLFLRFCILSLKS